MNEQELLKEIQNLESQINKDELLCRGLRSSDWDALLSWWDFWPGWSAPSRDFLPGNGTSGLMIQKNGEPIVAGFIYETNSSGAMLEWIVSNPKYKQKDRSNAIEMLIVEAEKWCKENGYGYMFTIGRSKSLIEKHRKLGWVVDDKPSHEITKKIK